MKVRRATIAFLGRQLTALTSTRSQNGKVLRGFVDNLNAVLGAPTPPNVTTTAEAFDTDALVEANPLGLFAQIRKHHHMALRALKVATPGSNLAFYGVDPARLDFTGTLNLPQTLSTHTAWASPELRSWFGPDASRWTHIAFDPKVALSHSNSIERTDLTVLSPLAIVLVWVLRFWRVSPLLSVLTLIRLWSELAPQEQTSRRNRIVEVLSLWAFTMGVVALIRPAKEIKMLCLTANSTFLEALRALVAGLPGGYVVEILHGVNSPTFDEYFLSYRAALADGDLGQFVMLPMLAHPFALAPERTPGFSIVQVPSNTGIIRSLNRALACSAQPSLGSITAAHSSKITTAIVNEMTEYCQPGRPLVAIWGGTDLDPDFYRGLAFCSEFALAEKIRKEMAAMGFDPMFVYFPHPTNRPIEALYFEDGTPIAISKKTHLGYFCADYAIGLYSSSIFESAAFGAHTFSPLTANAGLMYAHMFDGLTTPKELTVPAIDAAITHLCQLPADGMEDHAAKIAYRVGRFLAGEI